MTVCGPASPPSLIHKISVLLGHVTFSGWLEFSPAEDVAALVERTAEKGGH